MSLVRLGDVVEVIAGQSPPSWTYNQAGTGLPFFQGKVDFGPQSPVPRVWCSRPERIAEPGDVLLSVRAPVGPSNVADVRCCIGRGLAAIRPGPEVNPSFLAWFIRLKAPALAALGQGSTFPAISRRDIEELPFPLLTLAAQGGVAARLDAQLAQVGVARHSTIPTVESSRLLGLRILAGALVHVADAWSGQRLGDIVVFGRSPSVTSDGDTAVTTVTSGCLTPLGFAPTGLRVGRMSSQDAVDGAIGVDEVLVSRSNTEALVGRVSRYPGGPDTVVASDLVLRLIPDPMSLNPEYLASHLSVLQLAGYWRNRSSGASSTMKKITKALISSVEVPLPPLAEQLRIVENVRERIGPVNALEGAVLAAREAIDALPAALLRRAFEGLAV